MIFFWVTIQLPSIVLHSPLMSRKQRRDNSTDTTCVTATCHVKCSTMGKNHRPLTGPRKEREGHALCENQRKWKQMANSIVRIGSKMKRSRWDMAHWRETNPHWVEGLGPADHNTAFYKAVWQPGTSSFWEQSKPPLQISTGTEGSSNSHCFLSVLLLLPCASAGAGKHVTISWIHP